MKAPSPGRPFAQVIGDPIAHSKSPTIHNFWLEKLGIEADYTLQQVPAGGLAAYCEQALADPNWLGCNVTMPLKHEALERSDIAHSTARRIGASNTLVRGENQNSSQLGAFNTDAVGFLEPLRSELDTKHYFRMARILGTGGAARAIVTALYEEGFTLVLAGRDPAKARAMLDELAPNGDHHAVALDHFATPTDFAFDEREGCLDVIINASPLGMLGKGARAAGFQTLDGYHMLIGQAAAAFEKFFGVPAPREHDAELRERLLS